MKQPDRRTTERDLIGRGFEWVENLIYITIGILLALAALAFLVYSVFDVVTTLDPSHFTVDVITLLGRLLLVLLIVELMYTVQVSYRAGTLVLEPFLFVGVIAAIRRIFVITGQFSELETARTINFSHFIIELGALAGLILVIVVALWILRHSETQARASTQTDDSHDQPRLD